MLFNYPTYKSEHIVCFDYNVTINYGNNFRAKTITAPINSACVIGRLQSVNELVNQSCSNGLDCILISTDYMMMR